MKLLPRPKKIREQQGFYELGFQRVIVIDETICENGAREEQDRGHLSYGASGIS